MSVMRNPNDNGLPEPVEEFLTEIESVCVRPEEDHDCMGFSAAVKMPYGSGMEMTKANGADEFSYFCDRCGISIHLWEGKMNEDG